MSNCIIVPNIDKHYSIKCAPEINQICKPLFDYFPITHFHFFRRFNDGSRIWFCSSPYWTKYLYGKEYWIIDNFSLPESSGIHIGSMHQYCFLWDSLTQLLPRQDALIYDGKVGDALNHFDITNGFAIIEAHKDYKDFYAFATSKKNNNIAEFYFTNLDIFRRFILYFREKAQPLIVESEKHKLFIPDNDLIQNLAGLFCNNEIDKDRLKEFFAVTKVDRLMLPEQQITISKRELECLVYISHGLSTKQVGKLLKLSPRTIEAYVRNIKKKLNFKKQSELTAYVFKQDLETMLRVIDL